MTGTTSAHRPRMANLRASQINGRGFCVDSGAKTARRAGETDERLFAVAAWRDTPYFTDAERAALALTEANVFNRLNVSTRQPAGSGW